MPSFLFLHLAINQRTPLQNLMIYQFRKAPVDTPAKKGNSSIISTLLDNEEEGDLIEVSSLLSQKGH